MTALTTIVFDVPLPPRTLSNNWRAHWVIKARATRDYREAVCWLAFHARNGGWGMCHAVADNSKMRVSLLFGIKGGKKLGLYQPRDEANACACAKALYDGLKDGGLIWDDSVRYMEMGPVTISAKVGPWVRVTVEEVLR